MLGLFFLIVVCVVGVTVSALRYFANGSEQSKSKLAAPAIQKTEHERKFKEEVPKRIPASQTKKEIVLPSLVYSFEALQRYADQDDVCKVASYDDFASEDLARLFIGLPGGNAEADGVVNTLMDAREGPLNGSVNSKNESVVVDFFNALLLSDQLIGVTTEEVDLNRAIEIFERLSARDSDNGAHLFFMAGAALLDGKSDKEIKELFKEIFKRPRFDNYLNFVLQDIEQRSFRNPTYHMLFTMFLGRIARPNYEPVFRSLERFMDEGDATFNEGATKFCQTMMDVAIQDSQHSTPDTARETDYRLGRKCYLKAWARLNPGRPEIMVPPYETYWKENIAELEQLYDKAKRNLNVQRTRKRMCERKSWDQFVQDKRQFLSTSIDAIERRSL